MVSLLVGFNDGLFLYKESYCSKQKHKTLNIEVLYEMDDADNEWYNIYEGKKRKDDIFIDSGSLMSYAKKTYGKNVVSMIERFMRRDMNDEIMRVVLWRGI